MQNDTQLTNSGVSKSPVISKNPDGIGANGGQPADPESRSKIDDRLLLRMNHEIRTAVNATLGMTELLLESSLTRQQSSRVNEIRRSTDQLLAQTSAILDLARAEAGSLVLQKRRFFPRETLRQTIELLSILASHCGIVLQTTLPSNLPPMAMGDPSRITEILITVVRAAMNRIDGGDISIKVESAGETHAESSRLGLTVAATGPYLISRNPPDISALDGALDEDLKPEDHYGFPMTLAKHLARLMDGHLEIEENPDSDTPVRFLINLTIRPMDSPHGQPQINPIVRTDPRPLKILLAEDSVHNQMLIRTFVKDEPWEIETAANGRIAVEKAAVEFYNLILMDLDMPEMDGYNATRQIRTAECAGQVLGVPIVALTAHSETEAFVKSFEAGCTAHVTKPLSKAGLIETIRRYAIG
jgi:CheY-like chemotaxis protein